MEAASPLDGASVAGSPVNMNGEVSPRRQNTPAELLSRYARTVMAGAVLVGVGGTLLFGTAGALAGALIGSAAGTALARHEEKQSQQS
jgi:outer membrane lipoprotein SlyB